MTRTRNQVGSPLSLLKRENPPKMRGSSVIYSTVFIKLQVQTWTKADRAR
jgi:hypothetical protein